MDPPLSVSPQRDCPNCAKRVENHTHCPHCGQRLHVEPLGTRQMLLALWTGVSSIESPTVRTIVDLLRAPGLVAKRWVEGRRTAYVHPIRFLLVAGLIVAFVYEPLYELRSSLHSRVYQVGLAHYSSQYFGLVGFLLVLPFAVTMRVSPPASGCATTGSNGSCSAATATARRPFCNCS